MPAKIWKLEVGNMDFNDVVEKAKQAWEEKLSIIKIDGASDEQRRIFYTALYQSLQMPTVFNDVNGDYTGFDKKRCIKPMSFDILLICRCGHDFPAPPIRLFTSDFARKNSAI
ncbi:MAG: glycoside hydrolase family 92 protein [Cyclobacteriaceae bacterium]|nr:glycoside hydrolase family 92 protein [Cyclobacteriaceae bacterium]